ncbi:MAG: hypothetical protein V2B15_13525 [Bacteroidota bacterium]
MQTKSRDQVFDYRALRLLVGIIAFAIPICVSLISSEPLSSISASYFTEARDVFVGMLFVVGAFLWAYNGHTNTQSYASKIASISAIFVALFPTVCEHCETSASSVIHYVSAFLLFSMLTYFCLGPFRKNTKGKGGKKERRSIIYLICGLVMAGCMVGMGVCELFLSDELMASLRITYWAETAALFSFGFAWMVAGKYFRPLVDKEEELYIFR